MEEWTTSERELSFEEAVDVAIRLQQNNQLDAAEDVLGKLREIGPNYPKLLHYSGVLAHQRGRSDEAIRLIERSLELEGDCADWHNNLGIVLKAANRRDEALAAYERAIALDPKHANAYNNLGVLLRAQGRHRDAEAAFRKATEISPKYAEAYHNLGLLLDSLNRRREAILCHFKVVTLCPHHPDARRLMAMAHCELGEIDKAIEIYKEWLEAEPDNPLARHMLAAVTGKDVPARTSDACVEKLFDRFADTFEDTLAGLQYQAPRLVAAMLEESAGAPSKSLDILDAGCGTGWCGPLVAPYARQLTGVDLSDQMMARAKQKNVYDELVKGELTRYLQSRPAAFDVVISADTLVYFGNLEDVTRAASDALRAGGMFIFTLEALVDAEADAFRIERHGRYSHSREYVERLFLAANLQPKIVRVELRLESGVPVPGLLVRGTKLNGVVRG